MSRVASLAIVCAVALLPSCASVSDNPSFPRVVLPDTPTVSYVLGGAPRAAATSTVLASMVASFFGAPTPITDAIEGAAKVDVYSGPEAWDLIVVFGAREKNLAAAPKIGAITLAPGVFAVARSPLVAARLRESAARGFRPEPLFLEPGETVRAFSTLPPPRAIQEARARLASVFPDAPATSSCATQPTRAHWVVITADAKAVRALYRYSTAGIAEYERASTVRCLDGASTAKYMAVARRGADVAVEIRTAEIVEDVAARMKR